MTELHPHKLADLVPPLSPAEYRALVSDIKANGLIYSIVVYDGQILDGRHRYRACRELGIEPSVKKYCGDSPIAFVLSANLHRRHLTQSQKAIFAADAEPYFSATAKDRQGTRTDLAEHSGNSSTKFAKARDEAAKAFGVNPRYVQDAKRIKAADPKLADDVRSGKIIIKSALKSVERRAVQQEAKSRAVDLGDSGIQVCHADFRKCDVENGSVDLIFTDPPYCADDIAVYGDLSAFASRVIRPGGLLLTFSGVRFLPRIYELLTSSLEYVWQGAVVHAGRLTRFASLNVQQGSKPILWFGRPPVSAWWNVLCDTVSAGREKGRHEWQQPVAEAEHFIRYLCSEGGIVCDPFFGSGTTLVAAAKLGRRAIGIDIDEGCVAISRSRVTDAVKDKAVI